jgi:hypothetical protein
MVPARLQRLVVRRARSRCEYCRLSQEGQEARFHLDHIVPAVHGGETTEENLALACVSCSLRKAAREVVPDPQTGLDAAMFNPRVRPDVALRKKKPGPAGVSSGRAE